MCGATQKDLGSRMVDIIGEDFPLFDEPDYARAIRGLITQDTGDAGRLPCPSRRPTLDDN